MNGQMLASLTTSWRLVWVCVLDQTHWRKLAIVDIRKPHLVHRVAIASRARDRQQKVDVLNH
jgi:hypothetical protein